MRRTTIARRHSVSPALCLRRGAVLLEVIVAMTILATAGLASAAYALQASSAVATARHAERELETAHAFIDAVALWPREEIEQRLGVREQGAWHLELQRTGAVLYAATLSDAANGEILLSTTLYRPRDGDE